MKVRLGRIDARIDVDDGVARIVDRRSNQGCTDARRGIVFLPIAEVTASAPAPGAEPATPPATPPKA